jgi:hypothetical protein
MPQTSDDIWADEVRDDHFEGALVNIVREHPEWELDKLVQYLRSRGFGRAYVDTHLLAITAAMLKARGEL